ncbi:hypothetical protein E2C01_032151 [Portunus trituberculatus]|uniref:Uncharacterized protein n=1 Tax=Portunus trituberculatus TaxID=210409 RepID=A0A5B7EUM5_PORTR|nr:hypothetical protein [Portunus trituberculatus]
MSHIRPALWEYRAGESPITHTTPQHISPLFAAVPTLATAAVPLVALHSLVYFAYCRNCELPM